jgi:hypothetical protein
MTTHISDSLGYFKLQLINNESWICGYCSHMVSSDRGYKIGVESDGSGPQQGGIYICPSCRCPTFFPPSGTPRPQAPFGRPISHLPKDIETIYEEARRCTAEKCYTSFIKKCV